MQGVRAVIFLVSFYPTLGGALKIKESLKIARFTKNTALFFEKAKVLNSSMITQRRNLANIETTLKKTYYGIL